MIKRKSPLLTMNRLESITDGIFAIIITIMVLGLELPTTTTVPVEGRELLRALLIQAPQYISYSISFFLIASFWLTHIHQFKMCVCTNRTHIYLNFGFLFFVSFIPFTTSLAGHCLSSRTAIIIFHLSVLFVYIMSLVQWYFMSRSETLINPKISEKEIHVQDTIQFVNIAGALLGIIIAIFTPLYSYFIYLVMPLVVREIRKKLPEQYQSCGSL